MEQPEDIDQEEAGYAGREPTRMIAMGSAPLMDGFRLVGFETFPDATPEDLDGLLADLLKRQEKALIILEQYLARSDSAVLERVRGTGGRIVVTEVPGLDAPGDYHPRVEELLLRRFGPSALEEKP